MNVGVAVRTRLDSIRRVLPEGRSLPEEVWHGRHVGVLVLLWAHSAIIPIYALARGFGVLHAVLEGAIVPATAAVATWGGLSRRTRTAIASVGLLSSSAVLVHLSGGLIEMHFHFFVMVAVVALYQDWVPFLAAIGYVFVHHGLMGAVDADSVYNHFAAQNNPWKWAAIHAFFVTGISVVCLVTWRLNERILAERRRAEERLLEETRIVETLHEVGKALAADLDTHRVVQTVTDAATELTSAAFGAFFYNVVDDAGESYMLYTLSGAPVEKFSELGLPRNTPLFATTFSGEDIVRLDDVTEDARYGRMPPHNGMPEGHLPVRSYLAVPVFSRTGDVIGGLFFGHPEPAQFTEVDERIVVGIAAQAAIALDNARLYESEREARTASEAARGRLAVLAEASRILTSSLEVDDILRGLSRLAAPAIADYCLVDLLQDDGSIRRLASIASPADPTWTAAAEAHPPRSDDDEHPVVRALRSGQAQLVNDVPVSFVTGGERAPARTEADDRSPTSAIVVPMTGRQGVLGVLSLATAARSSRRLGEGDLPFAEELARRAAIAVENARLYAHQRSVAETLQHSLLPERLPLIPGLATAARYLAGGPGVEVGGDWYDVIQLPGGSIVFAIGDVVGRGEKAASLMGQLRNAVRAYALDGMEPRRLMESLNSLLLEAGPEHMATMLYVLLDPETGVVRIVNAGHPPPLVASSGGDAAYLDGHSGVPIGALTTARYEEWESVLAPGDTLVLYTDGLVEDRRGPLEEGFARVRDAVLEAPDEIDAMCAHVVERALAGRDAQDDAAMLAVRLLPLGPRLHLRLPAQPSILAPLRATLRRWLGDAGATEQECYELLVAAGEVCTNAIRHATGPSRGEFEVDAELDGDVRISVRDRGRWRAPRAGVGGRGLGIVEAYVDEVEILRGSNGTEVRMRRRLSSMQPESGVPA